MPFFWRENFDVMPKKKIVCYCAPLPRRLPHKTKQRNETKKYKREGGCKDEERARDGVSDGGRNFGRETKLPPVRDVIGRIGAEMETRPTRAAREGLRAKEGAPPSHGLRFWLPLSFKGPEP
jgi:hypothetical protein